MTPPDSPLGPDEPNRSRRWLQALILLAGGSFLWIIYQVFMSQG